MILQIHLNSKKQPVLSIKQVLLGAISRNKQSGQGFLELALVAPVMIILVLGVVFIGLTFDIKLKTQAVAREAARVASKGNGSGAVTTAIYQAQSVADQYNLSPAALAITISGLSDEATPARGQVVTAEVTYHFKLLGLFNADVAAKDSEVVECWRSRSNDTSGDSCAPPEEQS